MKNRHLAIAALAATALLAASAQAVVIAGWDFSQHKFPGASDGGGSPLPATHASLDPNGAGAESGFIGQATYDDGALLPTAGIGLNCERDNDGDGLEDGCSPRNASGPVSSNRSEPFPFGSPDFDARSILLSEGQAYAHLYGMTTDTATNVTFTAAAGYTGGASNWTLSLGGRMLTGTSSALSASISGDGGAGACTPTSGSGTLTTMDARKVFNCPGTHSQASVTLTLNGSAGARPVIDNVAIEATPIPEPAATAQVLAGVACLVGLALRRR